MGLVVRVSRPGGPEALEVADETCAAPGAGEVLIRQTAIGLNFIDTYLRSGLYPFPAEGQLVPGGEAAGVVEAAGQGADFAPGDRVAYVSRNGAYRERRVMPADLLVRLPDAVGDEAAAAAMLKGLTAQYLLHDSFAVRRGDFVLVHAAAGGVGLILGQWLALLGAIGIGTTSPAKAELARAHGYAHVIPYEGFVEAVARLTGGEKCAVVYDGVGRDTYPGSLHCLRRHGTFVSFGQSSGLIENFKLGDLAAGGSLFATRPTLFDFVSTKDALRARAASLFARIADGGIRVEIGQRFPLRDAAAAHRALEARATTGSTLLLP